MKRRKLTQREKMSWTIERKRLLYMFLLIGLLFVCVTAAVVLVALDYDDIDLHTKQTKQVNVLYPKETVYVENNITNTQIVEKQVIVDPEYTQDCTVLQGEDTVHFYCPKS